LKNANSAHAPMHEYVAARGLAHINVDLSATSSLSDELHADVATAAPHDFGAVGRPLTRSASRTGVRKARQRRPARHGLRNQPRGQSYAPGLGGAQAQPPQFFFLTAIRRSTPKKPAGSRLPNDIAGSLRPSFGGYASV
jgi:hypothetical protein